MSDRSRSAMYDAVIQFFEEDPRRWITGCPARDDTGAPCDSLDEHAKRFCFLGAWMHLGFPPELCPQPIVGINDNYLKAGSAIASFKGMKRLLLYGFEK